MIFFPFESLKNVALRAWSTLEDNKLDLTDEGRKNSSESVVNVPHRPCKVIEIVESTESLLLFFVRL